MNALLERFLNYFPLFEGAFDLYKPLKWRKNDTGCHTNAMGYSQKQKTKMVNFNYLIVNVDNKYNLYIGEDYINASMVTGDTAKIMKDRFIKSFNSLDQAKKEAEKFHKNNLEEHDKELSK